MKKSKPYEQGQKAYLDGLGLAFCPYDLGKPDRREWQDGWLDASAQNQKQQLKSIPK